MACARRFQNGVSAAAAGGGGIHWGEKGWDGMDMYVDDPVLRELDRQQTETGNLYTCVFSFCFTNPAWNVEQTVIVSK